jgi:hypothetical protein
MSLVKYNPAATGTSGLLESNVLRKGNMFIDPTGPAKDNLYYNAIPATGGTSTYVVYQGIRSNLSIQRADSDSALIALARAASGLTFANSGTALNWFAGQQDRLVVNQEYPPTVTSGLVLNLDAGYVPSYPTTGTTWYDISTSGRSYVSGSNQVYNTSGFLDMTGTNSEQGVNCSTLALTASSCTLIFWIKTTDTQSLFWGAGGNGDRYVGAYSVSNKEYYGNAGSPDYYQDLAEKNNIYDNLLDGKWHMCEFKNVNFSNWTTQHNFNSYGSFLFNTDSSISRILIYDRTISSAESASIYHNGPLVTDGLVMALDAGNLISYPASGVTAYSLTGSYVGVLNNGTAFDRGFGGVFDFDGADDFIQIPYDSYWDSNVFGTATNFTISCWYKPDLFMNWDTMIQKYSTTVGGWFSAAEGAAIWSDANGFIAVFASGVASNPAGSVVSISYAASTLKWYHLCFTGDGTTLRFYVDGIQRGTALVASRTVAVTTSSNGPTFGRRDFMNGRMGPTHFYTRALTASEVDQNYNAAKWRFGLD